MGTSYHEQGSWNYVFGNFAQFLLALVVMAGYYNLYESLIALGAYVSEHWEGVRRREIKGKIENFIFEAHPFWSTFAIAMLCALPYMISFFPGPIQADAFEAVIAAIYLDGGMDEARKFVLKYIDEAIRKHRSVKDYKTMLQEVVQRNPGEIVEYVLAGESGPDHDKRFEVEVHLNSNVIGRGVGKSKKRAEQEAAREALELMGL